MYPLIPAASSDFIPFTQQTFANIVNASLPGIKEFVAKKKLNVEALQPSADFDFEQMSVISKLISMGWSLAFCYHSVSKKVEVFMEKFLENSLTGYSYEKIIMTTGWTFTHALMHIEKAYQGLIATNDLLFDKSVKVRAVEESVFKTSSTTYFFTPPVLKARHFTKAPIDHLIQKGYVVRMKKTDAIDVFSLEFKSHQFQEFLYLIKKTDNQRKPVGLSLSR